MHRPFAFLMPLLLVAAGCSFEETAPRPTTAPRRTIAKLETRHLPNAVRLHDQVISGGLPEGEAGFAELRQLGIKTVISVDGAKPDVVAAERHGLRYVHLPHGYDGIPAERAKELAKAVRDLPGPIYIHCHHGHHRSPAAAAVACIGAGLIAPHDAALVLQIAGTSPHYRGLHQSAQAAELLDAALLDALHVEFSDTAKLPAMAEAMVAIEQVHDQLQALSRVNWQRLPMQPDLSPEHESLLLREHFRELLRTSDVQHRPEEFRRLLQEGESHAQALETILRDQPSERAAASGQFVRVSNNCKSCHQAFRDVPLRQ